MHVGVDADPRLAEADRDHEVRGLPADALEREEGIDVVGDPPAEPVEEIPGEIPDHSGLRPVEADGEDQPGDSRGRETPHRLGRVRHAEQPLGGVARGGVLGPEREDARHEHPVGIRLLRGDLGNRGRPPGRRVALERPDHPADRRRRHGRPEGPREPARRRGGRARSRTAHGGGGSFGAAEGTSRPPRVSNDGSPDGAAP